MNSIFDLLDLVVEDSTTITLFSVDDEENILVGVSVEEARKFLERSDFVVASIEVENGSLCLNIEEEK